MPSATGENRTDAGAGSESLTKPHTRQRQNPERRCIVSGEAVEKGRLVRFAVSPGGGIVPDLRERLPGRGVWVSAQREAVDQARKRRLFAKALRANVALDVDEDLAETVERLLARRCLDLLGMARGAGLVVAGYEKVRRQLKANAVQILIGARDGAEDGRGKMRALSRSGDVTVVELFDCEELDAALGLSNCIHVAMAPDPLAERLLDECRRLAGFREGGVAPANKEAVER